jgi:hypothetical protein
MMLTPIESDALPDALARFAEQLTDALARTVFTRIAAPDKVRRAPPPQAAEHHRDALRLAAQFDMALRPGPPAAGVAWDGRALRIGIEAYVLLHEVAHFQLASPARRRRLDFGLGAGPETGRVAEAEEAATLFALAREREEAMASLLGILWEVELGHPALASFLDQNWLEGAGRRGASAHFERILAALLEEGFVTREGRPTRRRRAAPDV